MYIILCCCCIFYFYYFSTSERIMRPGTEAKWRTTNNYYYHLLMTHAIFILYIFTIMRQRFDINRKNVVSLFQYIIYYYSPKDTFKIFYASSKKKKNKNVELRCVRTRNGNKIKLLQRPTDYNRYVWKMCIQNSFSRPYECLINIIL